MPGKPGDPNPSAAITSFTCRWPGRTRVTTNFTFQGRVSYWMTSFLSTAAAEREREIYIFQVMQRNTYRNVSIDTLHKQDLMVTHDQ